MARAHLERYECSLPRRASRLRFGSFMSQILASVAMEVLTAIGFGVWLRRLLKIPLRQSLGETGLLGLVGISFLALLVHFVLPIEGAWTVPVVVIAFFFGVKEGIQTVRASRRLWIIFLISLPLLVILSQIGLKVPLNGDTGLYHLPKMIWLHERPIVPGLANLHGRFGFPSLWQQLATFFWIPKLELSAAFSLNATVAFLLIVAFLERSFFGEVGACIGLGVLLIFLKPLFFGEVGSPSTDMPGAALGLLCGVLVLDAESDEEKSRNLLWIVSVWAITIKLSQIPLLLLPLASMIQSKKLPARRLQIFLGICAGLWFSTNLLTSGCLAYPAASSCLSFLPWAVPKADAASEEEWLRSWARIPGKDKNSVLADWSWLSHWWAGMSDHPAFRGAYTAVLLALGFFLFTTLKRPTRKKPAERPSIALVPAAIYSIGILFWFFQAPDLRFGYGLFGGLAIVLAGSRVKIWKQAPIAAFLMLVYFVLQENSIFHPKWDDWQRSWPQIPVQSKVVKLNTSGQIFNVPKTTDRCWALPRPCTPNFRGTLREKHFVRWTWFPTP
jgi:hypothetical protein